MKMLLAMMALLLAGPLYASDDKAHTDVKENRCATLPLMLR